jgi:hypothetical protein
LTSETPWRSANFGSRISTPERLPRRRTLRGPSRSAPQGAKRCGRARLHPGRGDAHQARACTARAANLAAMPTREGYRPGRKPNATLSRRAGDPTRGLWRPLRWTRAGRARHRTRSTPGVPMPARRARHPGSLRAAGPRRELASSRSSGGGAELRCTSLFFRVKGRACADPWRERGAPASGRDLEGDQAQGGSGHAPPATVEWGRGPDDGARPRSRVPSVSTQMGDGLETVGRTVRRRQDGATARGQRPR